MIDRSTNIHSALRSRQRGFLLNPFRFGVGGGGDPYFANVSLLLHMDGANGSTTFTDSSGSPKSITRLGNAQISTAQSRFGGASAIFDGTGDGLSIAYDSSLNLSGADFTVEGQARYNGTSGNQTIIDFRGASAFNVSWILYMSATSRSLLVYDGTIGSNVLSTPTNSTPAAGNWFSWCVENYSGTTRIYIDGSIAATSTTWAPPATHASGVRIGLNQAGADGFNGYMDEVRVTKGVARYNGNYAPQTEAFPSY